MSQIPSPVADYQPVDLSPKPPSKAAKWIGIVIGCVPALMILAGGVTDILKLDFVVEELTKAGYPNPAGFLLPLGILVVVCSLLYLIPQTAVLGAVLLTAYLGGAVCHHLRSGDPLGMMIFPALFAIPLWAGLILRDRRVRAVFPFRR